MFLLNLQSKEPVYEQIQTQIIRFIQVGILKPGDKLPSVRQMAVDNGINPNTVARAYAELEKKGIVYNRPKKGVYVEEVKTDSNTEKIVEILRPLKNSGFGYSEVTEAVRRLYEEEDEHAEN